jgi:hypothetical protein
MLYFANVKALSISTEDILTVVANGTVIAGNIR